MSHRMPVMAIVLMETAGGSGSAAMGLGASLLAILSGWWPMSLGDLEVRGLVQVT